MSRLRSWLASASASAIPRVSEANVATFCGCALLTSYLGLEAGGFFPGAVGVAATGVAVVLVARMGAARSPLAGLSWRSAAAIGALALFAVWTLISAGWSHAPGRAVIEFNRAFFYLLVLALFASIPGRPGRLTALAGGVAFGSVGLCVIGFATRTLPALFPTAPDATPDRLSYPLTYSNAVGLLAVEGMLICLGLSASLDLPKRVRCLAAAALPVLGATLLLSFSRGSIALGIVGLLVLCASCRTRALLNAVLATAPVTAVAVYSAYAAPAISSLHATGPAAVSQGHRVAVIVALSCVGAVVFRSLLARWDTPPTRPRAPKRWRALAVPVVTIVVIGGVVGGSVAAGVPHAVSRQYHLFVSSDVVPAGLGRGRLLNPSNNLRLPLWRVALDAGRAEPLRGQGAGTFQEEWNLHRKQAIDVINAHSLYLEVFAELGLVGVALLLCCLALILFGLTRALKGVARPVAAGLVGAAVAYLLEAAIDWDWQVPAITWWLFAAGGITLARGRSVSDADPGRLRPAARLAAMLAIALTAVLPVQTSLSQLHLGEALVAFTRGNCNAAVGAALKSASDLGSRPEPDEVIGYCDARYGHPQLAVAMIQNAINRDPRDWEFRYDLAIVRGIAGLDPRSAANAALALNPLSPLTVSLTRALRRGTPSAWRAAASKAPLLIP